MHAISCWEPWCMVQTPQLSDSPVVAVFLHNYSKELPNWNKRGSLCMLSPWRRQRLCYVLYNSRVVVVHETAIHSVNIEKWTPRVLFGMHCWIFRCVSDREEAKIIFKKEVFIVSDQKASWRRDLPSFWRLKRCLQWSLTSFTPSKTSV